MYAYPLLRMRARNNHWFKICVIFFHMLIIVWVYLHYCVSCLGSKYELWLWLWIIMPVVDNFFKFTRVPTIILCGHRKHVCVVVMLWIAALDNQACQVGLCSYAKMEFFCVAGGPLGRLVSLHSSLRLLLLVTAQILLVSGQSQGKA